MSAQRDSLVNYDKDSALHQALSKKRVDVQETLGMYAFLDIQIQFTLVTEKTRNLLLGIAPLLEEIW